MYTAVTIAAAACAAQQPGSTTSFKAFVFLKIAEPNVQKPLDESNEIDTDDLMGMSLHVDLHFMASLVCTSQNLSTASGVKHGNIVES